MVTSIGETEEMNVGWHRGFDHLDNRRQCSTEHVKEDALWLYRLQNSFNDKLINNMWKRLEQWKEES